MRLVEITRPSILSLIVVALLAHSAVAETLGWSSALEEASLNNREIRSSEASIRSAERSTEGAHSGFFPEVSANLGYQRNDTTYGGSSALSSTGDLASESYSASLSLKQNIFAGYRDRAKVEQSEAAVSLAQARKGSVIARVGYELKSAYAGLLYAQRSIKLQEEIIKRRGENLRLVELRFEAGRENKGSVLLSKAYLEQAKFERLQAMNAIGTARAQLARVLGRESGDGIEVKDDLPLSDPPPEPDIKALAMSVPETLQARANEESLKAGVELARSNFYPSLDLTGSAGKQGETFAPENDRWSVGLTLSMPLFAGWRNSSAHESAEMDLSAARDTRINAEMAAVSKLEQAHAGFVEAVEKQKLDMRFLEAEGERAEIAREKYNNGLLSFDSWDIIENDLIMRKRSVLSSIRDRAVAEAAWEQAVGKGTIQ